MLKIFDHVVIVSSLLLPVKFSHNHQRYVISTLVFFVKRNEPIIFYHKVNTYEVYFYNMSIQELNTEIVTHLYTKKPLQKQRFFFIHS